MILRWWIWDKWNTVVPQKMSGSLFQWAVVHMVSVRASTNALDMDTTINLITSTQSKNWERQGVILVANQDSEIPQETGFTVWKKNKTRLGKL